MFQELCCGIRYEFYFRMTFPYLRFYSHKFLQIEFEKFTSFSIFEDSPWIKKLRIRVSCYGVLDVSGFY